MIGDAPASQFEMGHQKGGGHFCWGCNLNADRASDLQYLYQLPYVSYEDATAKVLRSPIGIEKSEAGATHYFSNLGKSELVEELNCRGVRFCSLESKSSLTKKLEEELSGAQRVPALLFSNPKAKLDQLNLQHYEVLACEPLHCVGNHIKNLYEELPNHLIKDEKIIFNNALKTSFNNKDVKRRWDYRLSLLKMTIF